MHNNMKQLKEKAADATEAVAIVTKKSSGGFPFLTVIAGVISYLHLPASAPVLSKLGSAVLVGAATSPVGLGIGAVAGAFTGAAGLAVLGGGATYAFTRDGETSFGGAMVGGVVGFFGGALLGAVGGIYCGYNWTQDYFQNLLNTQTKPQTSSMNVEFGQSATPYFKELQDKLKAEKGLVLDIAPKANAPKLSLA